MRAVSRLSSDFESWAKPVRGSLARVIAALGLFGVVLGASPVATPGPVVPVRIELDAPVGCSDPQAFSDALAERSPSVRFAKPGEPATLLRIRLTRTGNQVRGELSVIDAEGATDTRRVEGTSCDDVMRGLSLTASLALDRMLPAHMDSGTADTHGTGDATSDGNPKSTAETSASNANKPPPVVEQPKPKASAEPAPKIAPKPAVPLHFELGLELALAELVAPKWSAGGGPTFALRRGEDGPAIALGLWYLSNEALGHSNDLVVHWIGASLSACPLRLAVAGPASVEACGLFQSGRLSVLDRQALRGRTAVRSWWSAGGLVRGGVPLGFGLSLAVEFGVSFPLFERRFTLENPEQNVGKSPTVAPFLGAGVWYRL